MKEKIKKHNSKYVDQIKNFRDNPKDYETPDEKSSEDESSDDDSDDSDDSDSGDDDDDDSKGSLDSVYVSESSDSDDDDKPIAENILDVVSTGRGPPGRVKWLKRTNTKTVAKDVIRNPKRPQNTVEVEDDLMDDSNIVGNKATKTPKWTINQNMTVEELDKKVAEIIAFRGRKTNDPKEAIKALEKLSEFAQKHGPRKEVPILMHVISAMFDSKKVFDDYMELTQWSSCFKHLLRVIQILEADESLSLGGFGGEDVADFVIAGSQVRSDFLLSPDEVKEDAVLATDDGVGAIKVVGTLESAITRLEADFMKSLQQINPHTQEYVTRLGDEARLIELAEMIFKYYQRQGDNGPAAAVAMIHVEHIYYKHDSIASAIHKAYVIKSAAAKELDATEVAASIASYNSSETLERLCQFIFKYGVDRTKTRALLCFVHHHALHDRYYRARDMLLISHIQDTIDKTDIGTQIIYNRVLVTLGLCAFRLGLIQKAHECLSGICTNRVKELLAQGYAKWHDKDPEQEKLERRRQMPYHMHINPDLLEGCHLISAMLLELPQMARSDGVASHNMTISKHFRKYYTQYSKQVFTGPPENTREHVLASAKALLTGDWQKALDLTVNLDVWNLLPADGGTKVKTLLHEKMKEEAVRVYLLKNGSHYESLKLVHICEMFKMTPILAHRIISRMIFNNELSAAWDGDHPADPRHTLILYNVDPTPIQLLAQITAEKVANMVESNERLLDTFSPVYNKDDWGGHGGGGVRGRFHTQQQGAGGGGYQGDRQYNQRDGGMQKRPFPGRFPTGGRTGGRTTQSSRRYYDNASNMSSGPQRSYSGQVNTRGAAMAGIRSGPANDGPKKGWGV